MVVVVKGGLEEASYRQGIRLGVYGKILSVIVVEMKEVIKEKDEKLKQEMFGSRIQWTCHNWV